MNIKEIYIDYNRYIHLIIHFVQLYEENDTKKNDRNEYHVFDFTLEMPIYIK